MCFVTSTAYVLSEGFESYAVNEKTSESCAQQESLSQSDGSESNGNGSSTTPVDMDSNDPPAAAFGVMDFFFSKFLVLTVGITLMGL
jgi:hypothetical protein